MNPQPVPKVRRLNRQGRPARRVVPERAGRQKAPNRYRFAVGRPVAGARTEIESVC
jgi:hypothetical protein